MKNLITPPETKQTRVVSADTKSNKLLRVGTAFSGIGAAEQAISNLKIAHSNEYIIEWNKQAQATFLANFSVKNVFNDITKIDMNDIPKTDLFIFTPPCVDFSPCSSQKGFNSDSGKLVFDAIRIIEKTKPSYIMYENVAQMVSKKFKSSFDIIINEITKLGYRLQWKVLNSKDYGVPQNRSRVIIVGIKDTINQSFEFPKPYTYKKSINDIMVPGTDYTKYLYNEPNIIKFDTKRDTDLIKLYTIPRIKQNTDSKIFSTDGMSPTLRTGCRTHFYDTKNKLYRYLSIEERIALQSYPKDFKFPVPKTEIIKQLGNSVTVNLFQEIIKNLIPQYLPTPPKVVNKVPASITNASTHTTNTAKKTNISKSSNSTCISLLQTIKQKEGYVSGPIITKDIKAIRKVATDRTTEIIKENIDRPLLSKNMYINQSLIFYTKDQSLFDKIEKMDTEKLTTYLKDRDLNLYNYDSFADDSNTKNLFYFHMPEENRELINQKCKV